MILYCCEVQVVVMRQGRESEVTEAVFCLQPKSLFIAGRTSIGCQKRYSSCRYNERQLIHVTVVNVCVHGRTVGVIARGTAGGREPVGLFFAIDSVVHLLLNGTSLVTRDGAQDAQFRLPHPRALC